MYKRPRPRTLGDGLPLAASAMPPGVKPTPRVLIDPQVNWTKWQMEDIRQVLKEQMPENEPTQEPEVLAPTEEEVKAQKEQEQKDMLDRLMRQAKEEGYKQGLEQGLEEGRAQGFKNGYADGLAQAKEQAQQELDAKALLLHAMIEQSQDELARLQEQLGDCLVTFGIRLAQHILGYELKRPAKGTTAIVKEVLKAHDEEGASITIWLHPNDLKLIEEDVKAMPTLSKVRLLADDSIQRGGAKARTEHGDIDATLQTRWQTALAALGHVGSEIKPYE